MSVFVSLVTFNSQTQIQSCVESLAKQESLTNLHITIVDNNSIDGSSQEAKEAFKTIAEQKRITTCVISLPENLGFSGGHNRSVYDFLQSNADYFLVINPDVTLQSDFLKQCIEVASRYDEAIIITPKLFRASVDDEIVPMHTLDAAGMELTHSLRHFDRGSNNPDTFFKEERVFGGTGACLFFTRAAVQKLLLAGPQFDTESFQLFPQLAYEYEKRKPLFDEAFFAYREDADLSWRAYHRKVPIIFAPSAVGFHVRKVLPTNRADTSDILNGLSIRNRFLLQINNYQILFPTDGADSIVPHPWWITFVLGCIVRNFIVLVGVVLKEQSSVSYLLNIKKIWRRAWERRQILLNESAD